MMQILREILALIHFFLCMAWAYQNSEFEMQSVGYEVFLNENKARKQTFEGFWSWLDCLEHFDFDKIKLCDGKKVLSAIYYK